MSTWESYTSSRSRAHEHTDGDGASDILPSSAGPRPSDGEAYSWVSLPQKSAAFSKASSAASAGPQVSNARDEIAHLRMALEEKDFLLLESQSEHVKALAKMRGQVESRDKTIKDQKAEISRMRLEMQQHENRSMSTTLDLESEVGRLREQAAILRLKLEEAHDEVAEASKASDVDDLRRDRRRLQSENEALVQDLSNVRRQLDFRSSELASKDAELADIRAAIVEQQGKIRALHEQLSGFISKDASDYARVEVSRDTFAKLMVA